MEVVSDNNVADDHTASDAHEAKILSDLGITTSTPSGGWDRFDEAHSNQWQSVFDASYTKALNDANGLKLVEFWLLQIIMLIPVQFLMSGMLFLVMKY